MGTRGLGMFFKIATILTVIAVIMLFIVQFNTAEFYITVVSFVIAVTMSVISGILFYRSAKNDKK